MRPTGSAQEMGVGMSKTKVFAPVMAKLPPMPEVKSASRPRLIQRAAAAPVKPKPAPAPMSLIGQTEVNHTADFAAAGLVPPGKPAGAGRVVLVPPAGSCTAPPGFELRCFLHRDGSAVKFAGAAGAVHLGPTEAQDEFAPLFTQARAIFQAHAPTIKATKAPPTSVHRALDYDAASNGMADTAVDHALTHSYGQPLAARQRTQLESSFGADLGQVRLHNDTAANDAARSVQAHAFTTGQDIFFRSGRLQPETRAGQSLLAHEVAHTVQQGRATGAPARQIDRGDLQISQPNDPLEYEAEAAAQRAVLGQRATVKPLTVPAQHVARLAVDVPAPVSAALESKAVTAAPAVPSAEPAAGLPPLPKGAKDPLLSEPLPVAVANAAPDVAAASPAATADGLAAVTADVHAAGLQEQQHDTPEKKADQAKSAAAGPENEIEGAAKKRQVGAMAEQQPGKFNRESFKQQLGKRIREIQIADAEQAKKFKEQGGARNITNAGAADAKQSANTAAGGIAQAANQEPSAAGLQKTAGAELQPASPGAAPQVDGGRAVPPPRPAAEVSMEKESQGLDQQMAAAQVTPDQLQKANEPTFQAANEAKSTAQESASSGAAKVRQDETAVLASTKGDAGNLTQSRLKGMHGQRGDLLGAARTAQVEGKLKHEQTRARITARFTAIYDVTKRDVDARLKKLDEDVNSEFDQGATAAQTAFDTFVSDEIFWWAAKRYALSGGLLAIRDAVVGWPPEVNQFYEQGREKFVQAMDAVVDRVATLVETGLNEVVALIADGKKQVDAELASLPESERNIGQEAASSIGGKFADLEKSVEAKQTELIEGLAQKYTAAVKKVDDQIAEWKANAGGLIGMARAAITGVIDTILQMKALLMGVLARAAAAIDLIVNDPIGFLGNLVAGVRQGLSNFVGNIGAHMKKGLLEWLFGTLAQAGIQLPQQFDLSGILSIVLQVLGLTYANIRRRAVGIVGEKVVSSLEKAAEIFIILATKGVAGLWEFIKDKVGGLISSLLDGIKSFLIEKVIVAGITWIVGMLNPASAFVKACKAIYDIVTFFIERGQQILALVNAVVDSVLAIAQGSIGVAAKAVETALARAIPVAIGFLAGLLGLGGLSDKIKVLIEKIQAPINAAIDWVIKKAVGMVKAVGGMLGVGGKKNEDKDLGHAKNAARTAIHARLGEEATESETERAVAQVLNELRPSGLRSLRLGEENDKGERPILAEASLIERISVLAMKDVTVAISASIRLGPEDKSPLFEGIARPGLHEPDGPSKASPRLTELPQSRKDAANGTGRVAVLPGVTHPKGVAGRHGDQQSAGLILEPTVGSREFEVVAWNTSKPQRGLNVSHAERQFVNWFTHLPSQWKKRVASVNLIVEGLPICPKCEDSLRGLKEAHPAITFTIDERTKKAPEKRNVT